MSVFDETNSQGVDIEDALNRMSPAAHYAKLGSLLVAFGKRLDALESGGGGGGGPVTAANITDAGAFGRQLLQTNTVQEATALLGMAGLG